MDYNFIKVKIADHVLTLTLARSEKRNAFSPTMVNEIAHALQEANANEQVKLVLVNAEGPVFCAGMDIKTFRDPSLDLINDQIAHTDISLGEVFDKLEKPSIAIVEGDVIAGAFLIILGCTYVFADEKVKFRLPELELGIFPFQVMASLLKVMPEKKVLQLCLNTKSFGASRAMDLGIIDYYLEGSTLADLLLYYKEVNVQALQAGIAALRNLGSIAKKQQYAYLKECLAKLRN